MNPIDTMAYRSIDERLTRAQVALDNAQNDDTLGDPLAAFGYDDARLQEGQTLHVTARDAQNTYAAEYGDQFAATDALEAARATAHTTYMRHLRVARVAFRDNREARQALNLSGRRKQSIAGWLDQARLFYRNAQNDDAIQAGLAQFGVTTEDLAAGQAEVDAVEAANAAQEKEKGEAQRATERRDAAMDALHAWMSDFWDIARVAFDDDPQQLEKLGIQMPS